MAQIPNPYEASTATATSLATTTVPVNVSDAAAPADGQVLTAISGTKATWQDAPGSNPMTTPGDMIYGTSSGTETRLAIGAANQVLTVKSGLPAWATSSPTGTVTTVSVATANGLGGTVANPTTTPAITLKTTITGLLKGNGTAVSAATAGTDYLTPTGSAAGLTGFPTLNQNTTGSSGSCTGNAATATNLDGGATLPDYLAPAVVTLTATSSGTITVNAALGNDFRQQLKGSSATFGAPSNPVDGQRITIQVAQDGTGSRTVSWATGSSGDFDFGTTGTPTLSTAANDVDIIGFIYNASKARWCCVGSALGF